MTPPTIHEAGTAAVEAELFPSYRKRFVMLLRRLAHRAFEISAFGTMLLAWGLGYTLLCPAEPVRHVSHVAGVLR